jgi:hypothetical protein
MKNLGILGIAFAWTLAAAPMALADTYSFSYTDSAHGITLSGDLTTDASNNILSVTNATYADTATGFSGVATLDTNGTDLRMANADNDFYSSQNGNGSGSGYVDNFGILLEVGGGYVKLYYMTVYNDWEYASASNLANRNYSETYGGTFTSTDLSSTSATPEPSSWLLLGSGLLGLIGIAYHRRKTFSAVSSW